MACRNLGPGFCGRWVKERFYASLSGIGVQGEVGGKLAWRVTFLSLAWALEFWCFFLDRLCVAPLRVALWVEELPSDAEMR